jgi:hypothetical protein
MRFRIAVVVLAGAAPYTMLAAQSTGSRRPAPAPQPARPAPQPTRLTPAAVAPARASTESQTSIGVRVSTLGVGAEVSRLLGDHIGLRVGASYLKLSRNYVDDAYYGNSVDWNIALKGTAFSGMLDWYPGKRGVFRLSAGAISNPGKADGVGVILVDSAYSLSSTIYRPASVVGRLVAAGKYASVLPYVGLGFGTPASNHRGVGFICDLGVAIGRPTVTLTSTTAATTTNPTLRRDLASKQAEWQTDVADKIPVYPVLSLGVAYRF